MPTEKNQLIAEVILDAQKMERQLRVIRGGLDQIANEGKKSFEKLNQGGQQVEKTADRVTGSLSRMRAGVIAGGAAIASMVFTVAKATSAFSEYELVSKRLNGALLGIGISSPIVTRHFLDLARSLQSTTRFSEEAIINLQSMLLNFGVMPSQLERVTRITLDTATAFGKDVDQVGSAIAKAMQGYGAELARLIPEMRELTKEQLEAGKALDILSGKFAGQATKDLDTFAGALSKIKNLIGDIMKLLGGFIGSFLRDSGFLKDWEEVFQSLRSTVRNFTGETAVAGAETAKASETATSAIKREINAAERRLQVEKERKKLLEQKALAADAFDELALGLLNPEERIRRELALRIEIIDRAEKLEVRSQDNILEARRRALAEYDRAFGDMQQKQSDEEKRRAKEAAEARLFALQEATAVIGAVESGSQGGLAAVGAAGGAIYGGTTGAAIGGQIGSALPGIAQSISEALPRIFSDVGFQLAAIVKDVFKGIAGFITSFGGIGKLFGFGGREFQSDLAGAIADAMDSSKFTESIDRLIESLGGVAAQFRTTSQQLAAAQGLSGGNIKGAIGSVFDQVRLAGSFGAQNYGDIASGLPRVSGSNITDILAAGISPDELSGAKVKIRDPEKFQRALEQLDKALLDEANRIAQLTNLRIRLAQEEAQVLIDLNNNALKPIQENISKLSTAKGSIGQAISQVSGVIAGPEATLASLQTEFASATGGAKGEIGVQVKDALLQKLQAVQNLAAIGAISGESLAIEQEGILKELQSLQKQTSNELKKQEAKEKALLDANLKIEAELKKQTDQMRADAEKQIAALENIAKELKAGNLVEFIKKGGSFAGGTNFVPQTGFHKLHQGEIVISPQNKTQGGMMGGVTINLTGNFGSGDDFVNQLIAAIKLNKGNIVQQIQKKVA